MFVICPDALVETQELSSRCASYNGALYNQYYGVFALVPSKLSVLSSASSGGIGDAACVRIRQVRSNYFQALSATCFMSRNYFPSFGFSLFYVCHIHCSLSFARQSSASIKPSVRGNLFSSSVSPPFQSINDFCPLISAQSIRVPSFERKRADAFAQKKTTC